VVDPVAVSTGSRRSVPTSKRAGMNTLQGAVGQPGLVVVSIAAIVARRRAWCRLTRAGCGRGRGAAPIFPRLDGRHAECNKPIFDDLAAVSGVSERAAGEADARPYHVRRWLERGRGTAVEISQHHVAHGPEGNRPRRLRRPSDRSRLYAYLGRRVHRGGA
jgi:hypothetical protein